MEVAKPEGPPPIIKISVDTVFVLVIKYDLNSKFANV
jgi:hypothetical protein